MQMSVALLLISGLVQLTVAHVLSYPYAAQRVKPYQYPQSSHSANAGYTAANSLSNVNLISTNPGASSLANANAVASGVNTGNYALNNLVKANYLTSSLGNTNAAASNLGNVNYLSNHLANSNAAASSFANAASSNLANRNYLPNNLARSNTVTSSASRNFVTAKTPVNLAHGWNINTGNFAATDTGLAARILGDRPCGVHILTEGLQVDGLVDISGRMPFQSLIGVNGNLPTSGQGMATCGCGQTP